MALKLLDGTLDGGDVRLLLALLAVVDVGLVDLLLDGLDGLVGKGLVFEHCLIISICIFARNRP
jgi:hypothetical protein